MCKSLIVVTGLKRSGKDTLGDYIVDNWGYKKTQPYAMFKEPLGKMFGFSDEQMNGALKEVKDPFWHISPRELFQYFGTELMKKTLGELVPEYGENIGDRLWALVFKKHYMSLPDGKYVVCDWRFPEERLELEDLPNITFIRVNNSRCNATDTHASEQFIQTMPVDYEVYNNSSFALYYKQIDELCYILSNNKNK